MQNTIGVQIKKNIRNGKNNLLIRFANNKWQSVIKRFDVL